MRVVSVLLLVSLVLFGTMAFAQSLDVAASQPDSVSDVIEQATSMFAAFRGGHYREAIAGVIVLLVFVWRRFFSPWLAPKLSTWWVTFATLLLGFVGTLPEALSAAPFSWLNFVVGALLTSGEAMLFWQLLLKKIPWFQIPEPPKPEPSVPELEAAAGPGSVN